MQTTAPRLAPAREFEVAGHVDAVSTPNLNDAESRELLSCINDVRAGRKVFYVRLTNRKVTKSPKRKPNVDYQPDPALKPYAHEGWLVAAPTNKKRKVYLHVKDEARAKVGSNIEVEYDQDGRARRRWHHTRITMLGILSFKVLGEAPGPLAQRQAQPQAFGAPMNPQLAAQALMLQSQALMCQAQALMFQAYQPPTQAQ